MGKWLPGKRLGKEKVGGRYYDGELNVMTSEVLSSLGHSK